jgi:hypothetical protein
VAPRALPHAAGSAALPDKQDEYSARHTVMLVSKDVLGEQVLTENSPPVPTSVYHTSAACLVTPQPLVVRAVALIVETQNIYPVCEKRLRLRAEIICGIDEVSDRDLKVPPDAAFRL